MSPAVVDLQVPPLAQLQRRRSDKWAGYEAGVIASTIAEMDFPLAPPVARVLHDAIERHDLGYVSSAPAGLRTAFAEFAARRLDWRVDPEQVVLVPDVMAGIIEAARMLAGPAAAVAFASPSYPPFRFEPPEAGVAVRELPLRPDGGFDQDALDAELARGTRVVILANPHNPTGRVLPRAELERIAETCAAHDAWVLADEIHAPLVLPGATHVPWLEVSDAARERGIALTSASKAFNVAGLKAALLVTASGRAREAVRGLPSLGERAGLLGVLAAETAFREGDAWLDAVLAQLDANRERLDRRLAAELPAVAWTRPQATYLGWLDLRGAGLGDDPAATLLRRARVALSPGHTYGASGAGFARINFGTSPELLDEAISRIAAVVGA